MWFDTLLDREPDVFAPLVGHPSVAPLLYAMMGKQCQLRSFRAHINPGAYTQEWHMDFYGYWNEKRETEKRRLAVQPSSVNTTFYFQDNLPGQGNLRFVKNGHLAEPPHLYPRIDHFSFEEWCYAQEHVVLHPMAGDAVVFLSTSPTRAPRKTTTWNGATWSATTRPAPCTKACGTSPVPVPSRGPSPFTRRRRRG